MEYCSNRSHLSSSAFQSSCRNSVKLTQDAPATFRKESCLLPPITSSNGPSKRRSSTTTSRQQQVRWEPLPKKDYQVKPTSTLLAPGACCHRPLESATVLQGRDITVGHLKHSKLLPLLWRCAPDEGTVTECMYGTQYGPLYMPNTTVAPQWTGVASQDHQMLRRVLVEFGDAKANEQTGRQRLPVANLWRPQTHSVSTQQLLHSEASESLYDVKRISTGHERLTTQRGTHTDQVSNRSNISSATGATRLPGRGKTPHDQRLNPSVVNMSTFFEISEDLLQSYDCLKQISNAVMDYRALGFSRVGVRSSVPAYERLAQLLRIHKMVLRAKKEFGAAEMGGRPLLNTAGFSQKLSTTFLLNPPKENNRSLATPTLNLPRTSTTAPNLKQLTSQLKHHCIRGQPVLNAPPDDLELHGRKALIIQELQSLSDVMTGGEPDICLPVAVLMALVESADGECTAVPDLEGEGCTLQSEEGVVKKQAYINTSSLLPDASKISTADSGETSKIHRCSHFKKSLSAPVIMRSVDRKPRHWCSNPSLPEVESSSGSMSCNEEEEEEEVWKEGGEDDEAFEGSESLLLLQGDWSVSASRRSKHSTSSSSKYHRSSDGQALNATHKLESTAVLNDINDVINKLRGISGLREKEAVQKSLEEREAERQVTEKERHAAMLDKLRHELAVRESQAEYEQETLQSYEQRVSVWEGVEFSCLAWYGGSGFSERMRRSEEEQRERERKELQQREREAAEIKRKGLRRKLKEAQRQFTRDLRNESADLGHLLQLSQPFHFSYFEYVPEQTYHVPKKKLTII